MHGRWDIATGAALFLATVWAAVPARADFASDLREALGLAAEDDVADIGETLAPGAGAEFPEAASQIVETGDPAGSTDGGPEGVPAGDDAGTAGIEE